jgi:hypothetical protein
MPLNSCKALRSPPVIPWQGILPGLSLANQVPQISSASNDSSSSCRPHPSPSSTPGRTADTPKAHLSSVRAPHPSHTRLHGEKVSTTAAKGTCRQHRTSATSKRDFSKRTASAISKRGAPPTTYTHDLDRVRRDPSQHDILLIPVPVLKKSLIQLGRRGRLARAQPKLHHLRLLAERAVNAVVRARWQGVFAVRGGEDARLAVDFDGQATGYDLEVFPLARVEVGGWLLPEASSAFRRGWCGWILQLNWMARSVGGVCLVTSNLLKFSDWNRRWPPGGRKRLMRRGRSNVEYRKRARAYFWDGEYMGLYQCREGKSRR